MSQVKRIEQGCAGHLVGDANHCAFRRNTVIKLDQQCLLVSTIGMKLNAQEKPVLINCTYFETMVGKAVQSKDGYWLLDLNNILEYEQFGQELKDGYASYREAEAFHEAMVNKWIGSLVFEKEYTNDY